MANKDDLKTEIAQAIKENADYTKPQTLKQQILNYLISVILIVVFLYFGATLFSSEPQAGPYGVIHSPGPMTKTKTCVKVVGETRNLEPGQYVWLAVDKPQLGLCWPKAPKLKPNCKWATEIYEEGPNEPYRLSLYAVNEHTHKQWSQWLDKKIFGGVTMPGDDRRLDSVTLILEGDCGFN